eukprot:3935853-Rhodomonas_salina.1
MLMDYNRDNSSAREAWSEFFESCCCGACALQRNLRQLRFLTQRLDREPGRWQPQQGQQGQGGWGGGVGGGVGGVVAAVGALFRGVSRSGSSYRRL